MNIYQTLALVPYVVSGYILAHIVYRLFLSPLSAFPGPKLAAISFWYEFYWDVVKPGRFTWHLLDLHAQYGPIVRISPDEIHVSDPAFMDDLYGRVGSERHKDPRMSGRFGHRGDCFSTWEHSVHHVRRAAINPFFSAARIAMLQPLIRAKLTKLARSLIQVSEIGSIVSLSHAYMALTGDIITEYAFARCYNQLDSPSFNENYDQSLKSLYVLSNLTIHFPWIHRILDASPRWVTAALNSVVLPVIDFYTDSRREISEIRNEINQGHKLADNPTIFHELLNSTELTLHDKTDERLGDESVEIVAAGIITSSSALSVGTFHILKKPAIRAKLVAELDAHFPGGLNLSNLETDGDLLDWRKLESLPYLSGCVREAVRLSGGVISRAGRIAPTEDIMYKSYRIPRGSKFSMTTWHISHDSSLFPDPHTFRPERWLTDTKTKGRQARNTDMDRWLVAFGKGARQCAGINLAFAELYLTFAVMMRSFDMELYETDQSDVEVVHAYMVPYPKFDSKGVRVSIKGLRT